MTEHSEQDPDEGARREVTALPSRSRCWALAAASALVVAASYWMALQPGAADAQTDVVQWINDPPEPFGTVLAVTNSLLRPVPLTVVALALVGWIVFTARGSDRWEVLRAMLLAYALSEAITQILKRAAEQPRPTASIAGLDVHGYPTQPHGHAYPSAHTSVAVGLVTAMWPWLTWPQRAVGVAIATVVALNRLYIGAHWPLDVLGGAAIGLLSGSLCWLVAATWPIRRSTVG